ncbi:MAG: DUF2878 domain-containing protein [Desulfuromonas sp.]|nr:MAG: DUF2878 domain-containing protein [Desulfuromonas sp.]
MATLVNITLYQVGWFCCVLGAAWGYPLSGGLAALALSVLHVALVEDRKPEIKLMLAAMLIGIVVDTGQQAFGIFAFKTDPAWPLWLPLWIFVIWAQFATLFHFALNWLRKSYLLAALFGGIGGPLAYYAGVRLGAATFPAEITMSIVSLAVCWAVVTPFLVFLSGKFAPSRLPGRYRFQK